MRPDSAALRYPLYAGPDRRQHRVWRRDTIRPVELFAFAAALGLVGVGLATTLIGLRSAATIATAHAALRITWSMLFVCAGLFRLVRWRLTGESASGLAGSALLCFGLLSAPTAALGPLLQGNAPAAGLSPMTRVVAVVACLCLITRALMAEPVDARVRPLRVIWTTLGCAAGVLSLFVVAAQTGHRPELPATAWLAVGCLLATAWLALAGATTFRGLQRGSASHVWIGLGLLLLALAELLNALAFLHSPTMTLYATCLELVTGGLALVNSSADLSLVFSADGNRMLSLTGALAETERRLSADEQEKQERLHDARSVIAALKAASVTLDRYDARLDDEVKHRLRSSLVSELGRLEQVIDSRRQEPLQTFRLDVALSPVFVAERENGLTINNQLGSIRAVGRPLELATVVQNLLVNARHYASGTAVRIRAAVSAVGVQIFVEDRGPGVSPTEQERVFERGYRAASDGTGTGLGLYLARRLMREQGGEIVLRERDGGGAMFVLSLPGCPSQDVHEHDVAIGQIATHDKIQSRLRLAR